MPPKVKCKHCKGTGYLWTANNSKVGAGLRLARKQAGIGLRELARALNVSAPYLHDLEHGKRGWSPELLERYKTAITQ